MLGRRLGNGGERVSGSGDLPSVVVGVLAIVGMIATIPTMEKNCLKLKYECDKRTSSRGPEGGDKHKAKKRDKWNFLWRSKQQITNERAQIAHRGNNSLWLHNLEGKV